MDATVQQATLIIPAERSSPGEGEPEFSNRSSSRFRTGRGLLGPAPAYAGAVAGSLGRDDGEVMQSMRVQQRRYILFIFQH